jgi:hypothetical protein
MESRLCRKAGKCTPRSSRFVVDFPGNATAILVLLTSTRSSVERPTRVIGVNTIPSAIAEIGLRPRFFNAIDLNGKSSVD